MKIFDEKLYLEPEEWRNCGISEHAVGKAKNRVKNGKNKSWDILKDPDDLRRTLVGYEALNDLDKKKVNDTFGNPYEYMAKEPIRRMVTKDLKAEAFFENYRYNGTRQLSEELIQKYTRAASWLNMLIEVNNNKKLLKKSLNLSLDRFYTYVCEMLNDDKKRGRLSGKFPSTYQRLISLRKEYEEISYSCLIDWRVGNALAAKVKDEVCESILKEMLRNSNQHDFTVIQRAYNDWATANGYKTITAGTVGNKYADWEYEIKAAREGNAAWYDKFGKIIHRKRPSAPLLLVGSDDNDLDLYFIEVKKDGKENPYFRYVVILVMDAYNDYVLGYSIGEEATIELIKAAYLDAVYHIKDLTGGWFLPHQIQTDRFAVDPQLKGNLATFYQNLATFTPATAKVPRGKYIERAFGVEWHQSLKRYPNYAGHNITAQEKLNRDAVAINKKSFPFKHDAHAYIHDHISRMRLLADKKGKTRQHAWLEAFEASELSQERRISEKRMLLLFGKPNTHPKTGELLTNTITNGGLQITIDGTSYVYDIPDDLYLTTVGKQVQVMYEDYDRSRVLVTDNKNLHFVAYEYQKMSSAIKDYADGERQYLNYLLQQKKDHVKKIGESVNRSKNVLERERINAQSMLQAGVMVKQIKQQAERQYIETTSYNALDQM